MQSQSADGGWPYYGKDAGGSRYSSLNQINADNVSRLKPAWTFRTGELETYNGTNALSKAAFEATPLLIGRTLYFSTPSDRVFAIDAMNGKQLWVFDPKVDLHHDYSEISSRGVSVWQKTIYIATIDGRLIALAAETGKRVPGFGVKGEVDLKAGLGSDISVTSPPAVIGNLIVVGTSLGDNNRFNATAGTVRAYDVQTGKLVWSWDPIPRDPNDPAFETWKGPKAHEAGAANAWAPISADVANDLVFIPTSSPSTDYYGGERLGQNLYGDCIVALKASTGKMAWYFQVVHHDLWDYDIAAQPILTSLLHDGRQVPVVIIGTKMGFIFVLNRLTGKPVFPVEERSVPASPIAGEKSWPTQPFPVIPEPLGIQKISAADAWGITDSDRNESRKRINSYWNEGIFTPPSYQGSIMTPGNVGGIHWGGMCYDSAQTLLITNINRLPAVIHLVPREKMPDSLIRKDHLMRIEVGRQTGTPYVLERDYLLGFNQDGLNMLCPPPWGTVLAIDMHSGKKIWEVPLGYMMDPSRYPEAKNWGSLNLGGSIVTGGGLVFVAASMDNHLRAFDERTGALLAELSLPASAQATPMTYSVGGKQFVLIAAGGHGKLGTKQGDFIVAFTL
ncbi:MAG: pyrroloquinoline quinone-dependent dehydrogenase [Bacteroidota bacterium]|nr:pyrroloquinoline quinone-dependent dehydrogenase [Bacteroidota bacterium]